jgi:hypothetical protein
MERRRHNNGMQRTRATAFLSCTLNGRAPRMPGVMCLDLMTLEEDGWADGTRCR